jgi:hypothetical protein
MFLIQPTSFAKPEFDSILLNPTPQPWYTSFGVILIAILLFVICAGISTCSYLWCRKPEKN